jgi:hypothetical protein
VRKASHPQRDAKLSGEGSTSSRSASAVVFPGPRMHPGGAGGRHQRIGTFPTPVHPVARGRSTELHVVRRGAPAPSSRPGRLPSHPTPPVGNAGVKEENR